MTLQKGGKTPLTLAAQAVIKDFVNQGDTVAIIGTAGLVISVYDTYDVKPIPTAKDILGVVELADSTGALVSATNPQPVTLTPPGTQVAKTGTVTTTAVTADQIVLTYTVTTGKTFYMTNLDISADFTTLSTTGAYIGTASLESPSGTKTITQDFQNLTTEQIDWKQWVFPVPKTATSTTVIRVVCTPNATTSTRWRANFSGFEL